MRHATERRNAPLHLPVWDLFGLGFGLGRLRVLGRSGRGLFNGFLLNGLALLRKGTHVVVVLLLLVFLWVVISLFLVVVLLIQVLASAAAPAPLANGGVGAEALRLVHALVVLAREGGLGLAVQPLQKVR